MSSGYVFQDQSGLAQGITQAGGALGQALQQRGKQQQEQQKKLKNQTILQNTLGSLTAESSPMEAFKATQSAIAQGVPAETINTLNAAYQPILKQQLKTQADEDFLENLRRGPQRDDSQVQQGAPVAGDAVGPPSPLAPYTENELVALSATSNQAGKQMITSELQNRKLKQQEVAQERKAFVDDRKYHTDNLKEYKKKNDGIRESLSKKKLAHAYARSAIDSGETKALSWSNIGKRLNLPELQTAKGATLEAAGKENLLSNLSRVSAKAQNQWMEERLSSIFPAVGKSDSANLALLNMLEADNKMDEERIRISEELEAQDVETYGYVKGDLPSRVDAVLKPLEEDILNRSLFIDRQIYEDEKGAQWLEKNTNKKVPKGTPLTPRMVKVFSQEFDGDFAKAIKKSKQLGYQIPRKEDLQRWMEEVD